MSGRFTYRPLEQKDIPQAAALYNMSCESGETVYSPLTEEAFTGAFLRPGMTAFAAMDGEKLAGFIHGTQKVVFLPGETHENSPGYLTVIFVDKACRGQKVGTRLAELLMDTFRHSGKKSAACSEQNPLHLTWRIPGTPGHDHNKAPGVDENCAGYPFLQKLGFETAHHEIAMYMDLKDYAWPDSMTLLRQKLSNEGVYTGRYDPRLGYEFDGMCDRIPSEYWRHVLQTETKAWLEGKPNSDPDLWPDGIRPSGPRPILAATYDDHIVGFTGPVDKQRSGRGWFTGICVDPNFGRRSIGEVLFHLLMQEFADEGAAFTTLFTGADNHARRIYERAGLRVVCTFAMMSKTL